MRIGIIGSGNIGGAMARLWAKAGHEVAVSNSRGPESLAPLISEIGANARAATVAEASSFGDAVLLAIPFGKYNVLPTAELKGKIVMDALNYYAQRDGEMQKDGLGDSELVARHLAGSKVVKAFNTIGTQVLLNEGRPAAPREEREVIFVAGDDADAKKVVSGLIEELGFAAADVGSLKDGRKIQIGSPVFSRPMLPARAEEVLKSL